MAARTSPSTLYLVKQLELSIRARLDALLRPVGVTALQYTALSVLARRPQMSSADLARRSFVRPQSMADLVAGLERHNFIVRTPCPDNRRKLLISLTDAGRDFLREYQPRVDAIEHHMLGTLSNSEQADLHEWLQSCLNQLDT